MAWDSNSGVLILFLLAYSTARESAFYDFPHLYIPNRGVQIIYSIMARELSLL
jgi:hypothetical protein